MVTFCPASPISPGTPANPISPCSHDHHVILNYLITHSISSVSYFSLLSFRPSWTLHTYIVNVVMVTEFLQVSQDHHQFLILHDYQLIPVYHNYIYIYIYIYIYSNHSNQNLLVLLFGQNRLLKLVQLFPR